MAYEQDYDDVKYRELAPFMEEFTSADTFPHCSCSVDWVEFVSEDFSHVKRNWFIWDIEYICMNCEQSWIKRIHLNSTHDEFKLSQMPVLPIEMEEE